MSLKIELLKDYSGDWEVLLVNGCVEAKGHSIPASHFINLLKGVGFNANTREITDEQMDSGNYYDD